MREYSKKTIALTKFGDSIILQKQSVDSIDTPCSFLFILQAAQIILITMLKNHTFC
jgi:hypothetical protein